VSAPEHPLTDLGRGRLTHVDGTSREVLSRREVAAAEAELERGELRNTDDLNRQVVNGDAVVPDHAAQIDGESVLDKGRQRNEICISRPNCRQLFRSIDAR